MDSSLRYLLLILSISFGYCSARAAEPVNPKQMTSPRLLDGVTVEAVETYINPKQNEVSLGIGVYPFDAYYYGVGLSAGYTNHVNRNFSWEILNVQFFFSFQKDLTTELADRYQVNPQSINSLSYIISDDVQYVFAYGKLTLMEEYIRYFRASGLGGLGMVKTKATNAIAAMLGVRFEVFTRENFSWNLEVRDHLAVSGFNNYLTFTLGTGLSF